MSTTCPTCGQPIPGGLVARRARALLRVLDAPSESLRAELEALARTEEEPLADTGPREPTKTEALAEWMRSQLAQAGPEGVPVGRLREDAARTGITKSPGRLYAARRLLLDVVEFRANPDDPRDPLRWRLREISFPIVCQTRVL